MALSKDQLRAGAQRYKGKVEQVHLPTFADPETGDDVVLVRGLSATEFDAHQAASRQFNTQNGELVAIDDSNISAKLAVRVIVNEKGDRVLDDTDSGWFGESSPKDVAEVVNTALRLAGMVDGGPSADAVGNSDATLDGESSSGSQESTEQPPSSSSDDSTLVAV